MVQRDYDERRQNTYSQRIAQIGEALEATRDDVDSPARIDNAREALRLWEKQQQELDLLRARVKASIEDPRPRVPIKDVRRRIKERHEAALNEAHDDAA